MTRVSPISDIEATMAEEKALEQAIFICGNLRRDCIGETEYGWNKMDHAGSYLRLQRHDIQESIQQYFEGE